MKCFAVCAMSVDIRLVAAGKQYGKQYLQLWIRLGIFLCADPCRVGTCLGIDGMKENRDFNLIMLFYRMLFTADIDRM